MARAALMWGVVAVLCLALMCSLHDVLEGFYVLYACEILAVGLAAFYARRLSPELRPVNPWLAYLGIGLIALTVRLAFSVYAQPPYSVDRYSYDDYQAFLLHGLSPYRDFFFTYPQAAALLLKITAWFPQRLLSWHILTMVADSTSAAVLSALVERISGRWHGAISGIAYSLLAPAILESAMNAHLDVFVVLAVALTLYFFSASYGLAGAAAMVAGLLKGWPVILLPVLLASNKSNRARGFCLLGMAAAFAICTVPFLTAWQSLLHFWYTLLPVPGAGSMANEITSVLFAQNSLRAIVTDIPWLGPIVPAAAIVFALVFALAVLDLAALSCRSIEVIAARPAARLRLHLHIVPSSVALAAAFVFVAIVGGALAASPWERSQYAYTWWTPTFVAAIRGIVCCGCSVLAIFLSLRASLLPVSQFEKFVRYAMALSILVVLIHANNFGWYLLPVLYLAFCLRLGAQRWAIILALSAYYASYPSQSFERTLSSTTVASAKLIDVRGYAGALQLPDHRTDGAPNGGLGGFFLARFSDCPDGSEIEVTGQPDGATTTIAYDGYALLPLPARTRIQELIFAGPCGRPQQLLVPASKGSLVRLFSGHIEATFPPSDVDPGVPMGVVATLSLHGAVDAFTALRVLERSNYDPTFGGGRNALSIWVDGINTSGKRVRNVPVVLGDRNASAEYRIGSRYHIRNLAEPLRFISAIHIGVTSVSRSLDSSRLTVAFPSIVYEPLNTPLNWFLIIGAALLQIAGAVLAYRCWRLEKSSDLGNPFSFESHHSA